MQGDTEFSATVTSGESEGSSRPSLARGQHLGLTQQLFLFVSHSGAHTDSTLRVIHDTSLLKERRAVRFFVVVNFSFLCEKEIPLKKREIKNTVVW